MRLNLIDLKRDKILSRRLIFFKKAKPVGMSQRRERERERGGEERKRKGWRKRVERRAIGLFTLASKTKTSSSNFKVGFSFFIFDE